MITIISKRAIGFFNPNVALLDTGHGPRSPKYNDAVFITKGKGELERAPEWVNAKLGARKDAKGEYLQPLRDINQQNLNTWALHEADGHIMEVAVKLGTPDTPSLLEQEAAARQAELANEQANKSEPVLKSADELDELSKAQLLDHAEQVHGLELSAKSTKESIIAAVIEAQKATV